MQTTKTREAFDALEAHVATRRERIATREKRRAEIAEELAALASKIQESDDDAPAIRAQAAGLRSEEAALEAELAAIGSVDARAPALASAVVDAALEDLAEIEARRDKVAETVRKIGGQYDAALAGLRKIENEALPLISLANKARERNLKERRFISFPKLTDKEL